MTMNFVIENNELLLCYSPYGGVDFIFNKLNNNGEAIIRRTFWITREKIRSVEEADFDETIKICIGKVSEDFIELDSEVFDTKNNFFISKDIKLKQNMFIADNDISIISKIDKLIERDFYIGGRWEEHQGGIPMEIYESLIKSFPKHAELKHYANSRIGLILQDYFQECDKYQKIYDKFLKNKRKNFHHENLDLKANLEIELEQFSIASSGIKKMLEESDAFTETDWQIEIQKILQLLYPKYILATREVRFSGVDGYDKQPDFTLVDSNGYVDVLEIKKPEAQLLTKQASYRNNYVPVRELSGSIQQIEKYIYCLTSVEKNKNEALNKLKTLLPSNISPEIVNPQGILLIGRSNEFNTQQKRDFELIKRQYKNIADIMSYDDLVNRLDNIVNALKNRIGKA